MNILKSIPKEAKINKSDYKYYDFFVIKEDNNEVLFNDLITKDISLCSLLEGLFDKEVIEQVSIKHNHFMTHKGNLNIIKNGLIFICMETEEYNEKSIKVDSNILNQKRTNHLKNIANLLTNKTSLSTSEIFYVLDNKKHLDLEIIYSFAKKIIKKKDLLNV